MIELNMSSSGLSKKDLGDLGDNILLRNFMDKEADIKGRHLRATEEDGSLVYVYT